MASTPTGIGVSSSPVAGAMLTGPAEAEEMQQLLTSRDEEGAKKERQSLHKLAARMGNVLSRVGGEGARRGKARRKKGAHGEVAAARAAHERGDVGGRGARVHGEGIEIEMDTVGIGNGHVARDGACARQEQADALSCASSSCTSNQRPPGGGSGGRPERPAARPSPAHPDRCAGLRAHRVLQPYEQVALVCRECIGIGCLATPFALHVAGVLGAALMLAGCARAHASARARACKNTRTRTCTYATLRVGVRSADS